ncbi:MAG: hypothetical protein M0P31_13895 [Solirubrobacteraceae bacterium]|nr:hypothetical protein [Solirubrobacteraceae bacterium]
MSDGAPERVWTDVDGEEVIGWSNHESIVGSGEIEYVRHDLLAAAEAERDRMREALEHVRNAGTIPPERYREIARAALEDRR